MANEADSDGASPRSPSTPPVGLPSALPSWVQEKLVELGAENYTSSSRDAPYALLGLSAFWLGDFAAVDAVVAAAAELAGEGPWPDEIAARVMLQRSLAGVVASLRGQFDDAERFFLSALEPRGGSTVDEARVVTLSMRAALCSDGQPERALDDVAHARKIAAELGSGDLAAISAIGEGWALSELGRFSEAAAILSTASDSLRGDLERSVAKLRLAEVQLRMGDRSTARATVNEARQTFLDAGARYWGARSVLLTGAIDRDRGGRWLRLARELSLPDPAYERLFLPEGTLRIDLATSPSVQRDGIDVDFLTRHAEATVRLAAAAGESGVSVKELSALFWPDVTQERQRARLRTLLWQARNSLGADAWRLQRKRDLVLFDSAGVEIAGSVSPATIAAEFSNRRK